MAKAKSADAKDKVLYARVTPKIKGIIDEIKSQTGLPLAVLTEMAFISWFESDQFKVLMKYSEKEVR